MRPKGMKAVETLYEAMTNPPTRPSMGHTIRKMEMADEMFGGDKAKKGKKAEKYAHGGRVDGCAQRGKTKGTMR